MFVFSDIPEDKLIVNGDIFAIDCSHEKYIQWKMYKKTVVSINQIRLPPVLVGVIFAIKGEEAKAVVSLKDVPELKKEDLVQQIQIASQLFSGFVGVEEVTLWTKSVRCGNVRGENASTELSGCWNVEISNQEATTNFKFIYCSRGCFWSLYYKCGKISIESFLHLGKVVEKIR